MQNHAIPITREAVAVFQSEDDLQAAIDDLLSNGFDRAEISLLASSKAIEEKLGQRFTTVQALEDNPSAPRVAYVSTEALGDAEGAIIGGLLYVGALSALIPVVASGGAIAAGLIAAAIVGGSGAAIGTALAHMVGQHHAAHLNDHLEHGGLILWVRTWNEGDEQRAIKILTKHSGSDVHLHGLSEQHAELDDRYLGAISNAERRTYLDTDYVEARDGEYYCSGKLFSSETDLRAYIKRLKYLETLRAGAKAQSFDLGEAMTDPASEFATPENLMATGLPAAIKSELLQRWAYDAREQDVASGEGMIAPGNGSMLQDIERCIAQLESGT